VHYLCRHGRRKQSRAIRYNLQNLKKREACEIVLWNEPLVETLTEISFFDKERERTVEINPANLAD
jgi:hypothetical protein